MPPVYCCPRLESPLHVTGRVDDPRWALASEAVLTDPVAGGPVTYRTTVRLLYDATCLYLGFVCEDDLVWGTQTARNAAIFQEECVEAFLCPSGKFRQYYEINVSPRNTVYAGYVLNSGSDERRQIQSFVDEYACEGLLTRTHIDGELGVPGARGWSAEYAIPFRSLIGGDHVVPEPGDEWLANLYRIDSVPGGPLELYAWTAVGQPDFHRPWRFGTVRFM
jgi:hypothetical protein